MSDDMHLREKIREAIRNGRLPTRRPDRIWGGPSAGGVCALCREPLLQGELELEIEFARDDSSAHSHQVHLRCFNVLESERLAAPPGTLPPGSDVGVRGGGPADMH